MPDIPDTELLTVSQCKSTSISFFSQHLLMRTASGLCFAANWPPLIGPTDSSHKIVASSRCGVDVQPANGTVIVRGAISKVWGMVNTLQLVRRRHWTIVSSTLGWTVLSEHSNNAPKPVPTWSGSTIATTSEHYTALFWWYYEYGIQLWSARHKCERCGFIELPV